MNIVISMFCCGTPDYQTKPENKPRVKTVTQYTVLVTFCDSRPPRKVNTTSDHFYIDATGRRALSEWNGFYNVCELNVLSTQEIQIQP